MVLYVIIDNKPLIISSVHVILHLLYNVIKIASSRPLFLPGHYQNLGKGSPSQGRQAERRKSGENFTGERMYYSSLF